MRSRKVDGGAGAPPIPPRRAASTVGPMALFRHYGGKGQAASRHSLAGCGKLRPSELVAVRGKPRLGSLPAVVPRVAGRYAPWIPTVATLVVGAILTVPSTKRRHKSKEAPNFTKPRNGLFKRCLQRTGTKN